MGMVLNNARAMLKVAACVALGVLEGVDKHHEDNCQQLLLEVRRGCENGVGLKIGPAAQSKFVVVEALQSGCPAYAHRCGDGGSYSLCEGDLLTAIGEITAISSIFELGGSGRVLTMPPALLRKISSDVRRGLRYVSATFCVSPLSRFDRLSRAVAKEQMEKSQLKIQNHTSDAKKEAKRKEWERRRQRKAEFDKQRWWQAKQTKGTNASSTHDDVSDRINVKNELYVFGTRPLNLQTHPFLLEVGYDRLTVGLEDDDEIETRGGGAETVSQIQRTYRMQFSLSLGEVGGRAEALWQRIKQHAEAEKEQEYDHRERDSEGQGATQREKRRRANRHRRKAPTMVIEQPISLIHLHGGEYFHIRFSRSRLCEVCGGSGALSGHNTPCPACGARHSHAGANNGVEDDDVEAGVETGSYRTRLHGTKSVENNLSCPLLAVWRKREISSHHTPHLHSYLSSPLFAQTIHTVCPMCGGFGHIPLVRCPRCHGRRHIDEVIEMRVVFPPNGLVALHPSHMVAAARDHQGKEFAVLQQNVSIAIGWEVGKHHHEEDLLYFDVSTSGSGEDYAVIVANAGGDSLRNSAANVEVRFKLLPHAWLSLHASSNSSGNRSGHSTDVKCDLFTSIVISFEESTLGFSRSVKLLNGSYVDVTRRHSFTPPGFEFHVEGGGLPCMRNSSRALSEPEINVHVGRLIVIIRVDMDMKTNTMTDPSNKRKGVFVRHALSYLDGGSN